MIYQKFYITKSMHTKMNTSKAIGMMCLMMVVNGCITAEKCANRFPGSVNTITEIKDTMIITSSKSFDTIFHYGSKDTIFIQDKLTDVKVKIIRLPGDSIFIEPICPSDTIIIEKIRIEKNIERIRNLIDGNLKSIGISIFLLILLIFASAYFINSLKGK